MKRLIKNIVLMFMVVAFVVCGIYLYKGYRVYTAAADDLGIEKRIEEVREGRGYTKLTNVSQNFINGIVSVEDHRFYDHGAIDMVGIARSVINNVRSGRIVMGGSTITQQLAKNLFLSNEQTIERKVAEAMLAFDLERRYSKDEILELYINVIYYGDGYYGISEASEGYFNIEPSNLSFDQAVLLSGLPQSPENYSLTKHYDRAVVRGQAVLDAMIKNDMVEGTEYYYSQLKLN